MSIQKATYSYVQCLLSLIYYIVQYILYNICTIYMYIYIYIYIYVVIIYKKIKLTIYGNRCINMNKFIIYNSISNSLFTIAQ